MLSHIKLQNVGIKDELELSLASRLNVLTGDNGLGKSFLLDIIWFAIAKRFPQEINPKINSGYIAKPINVKEMAQISFRNENSDIECYQYEQYDYFSPSWRVKQEIKTNTLLGFAEIAIYVMSDGSYALWDYYRNLASNITMKIDPYDEDSYIPNPAFLVYTQDEIWNGKSDRRSNHFFNGLLQDWQIWQTGNTKEFKQLQQILTALSSSDEQLEIGDLKPFRLEDSRLYPTIKMPYGKAVLLPHCSSAIKRIVTLAYFLVYAWKRHGEAAELLGREPAKEMVFLVDEVEAHLHPKWQRRIVPALMSVMEALSSEVQVQLTIATHSPLVMSSLEPIFEHEKDRWIDFDLVKGEIEVLEREFEKQGTAENWLESEAFNLLSTRAPQYEELITKAQALISSQRKNEPTRTEIQAMRQKLVEALDITDPFLTYWRAICERKGWL